MIHFNSHRFKFNSQFLVEFMEKGGTTILIDENGVKEEDQTNKTQMIGFCCAASILSI